ncbi:MAG: Gx transporter family protein [Erysipelotrichales bacterium]|nr:Gx transporter family protein [Erysipelotrichales bacterium]
MKNRKLLLLSVLLALAIILGIIEGFLSFGIPFLRLGLANIITLIILYQLNRRDALLVFLMRVFIVNILLGHFFDVIFWMSFTGGLVSFLMMVIFKELKIFSVVGVSIVGAVSHLSAQLFVASLMIRALIPNYFFALFLVIGVFTGLFTGIVALRVLKNYDFQEFINE